MALFASNSIPCLLCGAPLGQRTDKNRKPYFVCDPCGIQMFIRKSTGIDLLERLKKEITEKKLLRKTPGTLLEIQQILSELKGTGEELEKLQASISIFSPKKNIVKACKLLKIRE